MTFHPHSTPTATEPRFPYEDSTLPVNHRVEDLLARLTLEDKTGLLFHTIVTTGDPSEENRAFGLPSVRDMILNRRMNHFNVIGPINSAEEFVYWHNSLQQIAARHPLEIPVTLSTDPRHSFSDNPGTAMLPGCLSKWPEPIGLAAIGSPERVEQFGNIARQEYVALGLRVALHPQIDLATEPRWARAVGTFGQDAELTSRLVEAYIRGFQGARLGPESVATMVKHFPGGGPQKDGEDPHFEYGKEQVYPGDQFEYHLAPFKRAILAGGSQMMPYYGLPVGTGFEEVGFGFNKSVITGLLRERFSFDGIVCTDWGLLTDNEIGGEPMPARAWGVECLDREDRMVKALDAGVDQFGGEFCTEVLIGALRSGKVPLARIDDSVRRVLREKFTLGLFDDRFRDAERAKLIVGANEFIEAGRTAQRDALTLLTNIKKSGRPTLPLTRGIRLYCEGIAPQAFAGVGTLVASPVDADVAILRLQAPYDHRTAGLESFFHAGSLDFTDDELARVEAIASLVPTVIDVFLERPAILTPLAAVAASLIASFGCSDDLLLDVIFGKHTPQGSLPFEIPRSMAAVEASREDVPSDTANPLFRFGHGLRFE